MLVELLAKMLFVRWWVTELRVGRVATSVISSPGNERKAEGRQKQGTYLNAVLPENTVKGCVHTKGEKRVSILYDEHGPDSQTD